MNKALRFFIALFCVVVGISAFIFVSVWNEREGATDVFYPKLEVD